MVGNSINEEEVTVSISKIVDNQLPADRIHGTNGEFTNVSNGFSHNYRKIWMDTLEDNITPA